MGCTRLIEARLPILCVERTMPRRTLFLLPPPPSPPLPGEAPSSCSPSAPPPSDPPHGSADGAAAATLEFLRTIPLSSPPADDDLGVCSSSAVLAWLDSFSDPDSSSTSESSSFQPLYHPTWLSVSPFSPRSARLSPAILTPSRVDTIVAVNSTVAGAADSSLGPPRVSSPSAAVPLFLRASETARSPPAEPRPSRPSPRKEEESSAPSS
mmetsp:Transcript_47306/g.143259  ORF Transcript_47306/g.143259 Transcript_47306/m.143259 type:complete len:210 (-) Transcript_47306:632-1261(-)